jgi:hypothetical protein
MTRKLFVKPIVAAAPATLPVNVLLALPEASRAIEPLFNLPGAVNSLLGDWHCAVKVMNPKVFAPAWNSNQFRDFLYRAQPAPSSLPETCIEDLRAPSFLGLAGAVPVLPATDEISSFAVVHCVSSVGRNYDGDSLLWVGSGQSYPAGILRDALVRSGTRLLILQTPTRDNILNPLDVEQQLAEFIVGAGGPAVLIVAGDEPALNQYLLKVYSRILQNQSLERATLAEKNGPVVCLVCGDGANNLLQFDGLIGKLEKQLDDYSSLVSRLLYRIGSLQGDQLRALGADPSEIGPLKELDVTISSERKRLKKVKTMSWGQEHQQAILLSEIAEHVENITEDIGWHPGEGPCHTKYDMLEYRLERFQQPVAQPCSVGEIHSCEASPAAEPFIEVTVFFGTNRSKAADGVYYGAGRDSMHYGRCVVSVPSDRRIGKIPRPSIWNLFREDRKKHYTIVDVSEHIRDEFASDLRTYVNACELPQAMVFVHGFNVNFADAVFRTAQIAADLNFPGAPILFSWPSKGVLSPVGYTHDETQARWTLPDLRNFLEMVAEQSGASTIHLLAHSMGNRALTDALCQIGLDAGRRSAAIFNELILTAPDIDADTFTRDSTGRSTHGQARYFVRVVERQGSEVLEGYPWLQ